ncbi:hypothetical protein Ahy_A10g049628 isoform A [Arachis hypogaea]|uniref:Small ribosomal subunit protein uS17 N-terminal domain-containing protein n=1 Tax=Arachis hypogaea TaxID=3818 RepID=A0A445B7L2_ARAHY|nr:hypothetical protein Ahy_A10g049628 isoform A [Arachis hypogaea]
MKNPATSAPLRVCLTVRASVPLPPGSSPSPATTRRQSRRLPFFLYHTSSSAANSPLTILHVPHVADLSVFTSSALPHVAAAFEEIVGGTEACKAISFGFKTPRDAIQGTYINKKFPSTATISIQGCIVAGICHSAKMTKIRRNYLHFIQKYQRQGFSTFL